ncbi:MAG TPA: NADH:flavin oxidoreductase [Candidatus Cloacimonadota bacterium]|nr:NADH:flavin oxidoreductase [Candidatus Cloacimonadota bacterium]HPT71231.1 NADH:flavin oxidoreductase [Candidatus Cloacimonadota bacterium]
MKTSNGTFGRYLFRSATFEGMADCHGIPSEEYINLYRTLAENGVKKIITGCTYISREGMMVQPGQAGIDSDEMIPHFTKVAACVHEYDSQIYMQISHAGRQTSSTVTGMKVVGASEKKSPYFMSKPKALSIGEIDHVIESYAHAALRAKQSGFDGVQIHAAHGYLVHQFLHPYINNRTDEYGINKGTGIGDLFLRKVISSVREKCGDCFPILVKISASDDLPIPFSQSNFSSLIQMLHNEKVFAIEISYGTMEDALSIFRGKSIPIDTILKYNFRYKQDSQFSRRLWKLMILTFMKKRFVEFREDYNLSFAELAKSLTDIPIICVGGFRNGIAIMNALAMRKTDYVSLCRPFICEPDLIRKFDVDEHYISKCENCNMCAIMCDSTNSTRCYKR